MSDNISISELAEAYGPPAEKPDDIVERCAKVLAESRGLHWPYVAWTAKGEFEKDVKTVLDAAGFERLCEYRDRLEGWYKGQIEAKTAEKMRAEQAETALAEARREIEHTKANLAAVLEGEAEAERERDEWKAKAESSEQDRLLLCGEHRKSVVSSEDNARRAAAALRNARELENRIGLLAEELKREQGRAAELEGAWLADSDLRERNAALEKVAEAARRYALGDHPNGDDMRAFAELVKALDAAQPKDWDPCGPMSQAPDDVKRDEWKATADSHAANARTHLNCWRECRGDLKTANDILSAIDALVGIEATEYADLPGIVERTRDKCIEQAQRIVGLEKVAEAAEKLWREMEYIPPHLRDPLEDALGVVRGDEAINAAQPKDWDPCGPMSQAPDDVKRDIAAERGWLKRGLESAAQATTSARITPEDDGLWIPEPKVSGEPAADDKPGNCAGITPAAGSSSLSPDTLAIIAAMFEMTQMIAHERSLNEQDRYAGIDYARKLAERMGER